MNVLQRHDLPVVLENLTDEVQREKPDDKVLFAGTLQTMTYDAGHDTMRPTRLAGKVSMRPALFEQLREALRTSGNASVTVCDGAITLDRGGDIAVNPDRMARCFKVAALNRMPILFNGGVYRVSANFIPVKLAGVDA